jgi:DNA invertase Pin-like site-specific DNA recombinase
MAKKKRKQPDWEGILADVDGGMTIEVAAARNCVRTDKLRAMRNRRNEALAYLRRVGVSEHDTGGVCADYLDGHPVNQIADSYDIPSITVYRCLEARCLVPMRQRLNAERIEAVSRFFDGEKPGDLAKEYGVSRPTIYDWMTEAVRGGYVVPPLKRGSHDDT